MYLKCCKLTFQTLLITPTLYFYNLVEVNFIKKWIKAYQKLQTYVKCFELIPHHHSLMLGCLNRLFMWNLITSIIRVITQFNPLIIFKGTILSIQLMFFVARSISYLNRISPLNTACMFRRRYATNIMNNYTIFLSIPFI